MVRKILSLLAVFSAISLSAAGFLLSAAGPVSAAGTASAEGKIKIFVSVPPQAYFVKAIGGERVEISVMVAPEKSPADYEPSPRQMVALSRADIYFAIGVPFESAWLDKFAGVNPDLEIIHTEKDIVKRPIADHHGHSGAHEEIKDPHIWLSPPLVVLQARRIMSGLTAEAPESASLFTENYKNFVRQVAELDTELIQQFNNISNLRFMVFHPSWGYFADAYGLVQIPIEVAGKAPKAKDVQRLIERARQSGITSILTQPQFSDKQARIIAREIGARVIPADPLARDWAENLRAVARAIKKGME